jgi:hypothetical protein
MGSYSLHLAGALLTFILKVMAGFVLCLSLARLMPSPRHRFLTWLGFLLGAGFFWIALVTDQIVSLFARSSAGGGFIASGVGVGGEHLLVPASWSVWIGRAAIVLGTIYLALARLVTAWKTGFTRTSANLRAAVS